MHVHEPAIATAAALTIHWAAGDIEAVVLLIADIKDQQMAEDIIVTLLNLRGQPLDEVRKLALAHA